MPHSRQRPSLAVILCGLLAAATSLAFASPAAAEVKAFPASFHAEQMPVSGGTQHVRVGGSGPAVLLLHGFGDTGDMWEPIAEILG